jgi:hypothetical protein
MCEMWHKTWYVASRLTVTNILEYIVSSLKVDPIHIFTAIRTSNPFYFLA